MNSLNTNRTIFVKQNSTLPEVKFSITQTLMEKYDLTDDMMENVAVTFSMIESSTGNFQIANSPAKLIVLDRVFEKLDEPRYTLAYRFKLSETKNIGRFFGEFVVDFLGDEYCGKIKFPVDDTQINIIIGDSITKTTVL